MYVEKKVYDRRSRPNILQCQIATCKLLSRRATGAFKRFLWDIFLMVTLAMGRVSEKETRWILVGHGVIRTQVDRTKGQLVNVNVENKYILGT